jgi:hypothetical protein
MAKTIEIVERINSHANSWERDDALDAREPTEEARFWRETALTIEALAKALEPFADAWDVAMACHSPQMTMGRLGIVAAHEVTGVHFRNARSALPAAMTDTKTS